MLDRAGRREKMEKERRNGIRTKRNFGWKEGKEEERAEGKKWKVKSAGGETERDGEAVAAVDLEYILAVFVILFLRRPPSVLVLGSCLKQ